MMVKGLLFFVPLISYFQFERRNTRCEGNSLRITTNSRSSPGRGEIPRPDEAGNSAATPDDARRGRNCVEQSSYINVVPHTFIPARSSRPHRP